MPIKILNWNVEQFGTTRANMSYRLEWVCRNLAKFNADIASIVEIKTKSPAAGIMIADLIVNRLQHVHGITYNYILSYHNKLELHLFLYKINIVRPVTLGAVARAEYDANSISTAAFTLRTAGVNSTLNINSQINNHFPLINYANMGTARPLAVGFFREVATGTNFALMSWHNMAGRKGNATRPVQEMNRLAQTGYITGRQLTISIGGTPTNFNNFIISGDFNVDYLDNNYTGRYTQFTNYTTEVDEDTMLADFNRDASYNQNNVATACFDNFIRCGFAGRVVEGSLERTVNNCHSVNEAKKIAFSFSTAFGDNFLDEIAESFHEKFMEDDDNPYVPDDSADELESVALDICNRARRLTVDYLNQQFKRFENLSLPRDTFNDYINKLIERLKNENYGVGRVYGIASKSQDPNWGDALYLHRSVFSDHMPTILTIT